MKRNDIDECLEIIWHLIEGHGEASIEGFEKHNLDNFTLEVIEKLEMLGFLKIIDKFITLTKKGKSQARQVVRCHRLAERLLTDVLGMKPDEIENGACEFEHIIAPEIVDSICTLLGHPKLCPHGIKIPEGDCCKKLQDSVNSVVIPLIEGTLARPYKVAYINTKSDSRLQKLLNYQILPGSIVHISQRYPTYVIYGPNIQLALDQDIVKDIFVWKNSIPPSELTSFRNTTNIKYSNGLLSKKETDLSIRSY